MVKLGNFPCFFGSLGDPMFQMLEILLIMFIDLPPRMKPGVRGVASTGRTLVG